jgi:MoaD family protein
VPSKVTVRLFHELRTALGESEIEVEADTIGDLIASLISRKNTVREVIYDSKGKVRAYTTVYINNAAQNPTDFSQKLNDGDLVLLVPTAAGG